jgi:hypothetical protein
MYVFKSIAFETMCAKFPNEEEWGFMLWHYMGSKALVGTNEFAIKSFELNELQLKGQIFVSSTRSSIIPTRVFRILTILETHIKCFCNFTIQRSNGPCTWKVEYSQTFIVLFSMLMGEA